MISKTYELLKDLNIPLSYASFKKKTKPPYIIFMSDGSNNFSADNKVYFKSENMRIELYTEYKDIEMERRIEKLLDDNEIYYDKSEDILIDEEKLLEIIYYI